MSIIVSLGVMLAKRKMASGKLAERVGSTAANLSLSSRWASNDVKVTLFLYNQIISPNFQPAAQQEKKKV